MTEFNDLIQKCGFSNRGAADLFDVRYDTIKNWRYGKSAVPERVMQQMRDISNAVAEIAKERGNEVG